MLLTSINGRHADQFSVARFGGNETYLTDPTPGVTPAHCMEDVPGQPKMSHSRRAESRSFISSRRDRNPRSISRSTISGRRDGGGDKRRPPVSVTQVGGEKRPLLFHGIKYDYWGILLVAIGSVGVLYGITNIAGSLTSVGTWLPIVVGLAAFALFALYESKSKIAIFPMQLFKSPVFISAVLLGLMWNFAQAAVNLQLSNLWQWYLHWSPIEVTIYSLPMSVMIIIFALIAGKSISKGKSLKSRVMIGFAGITLGCLSFAFIPLDQGYLYYLPGILLMGAGLAYSTIAEGKMFIAQAPKSKFGAVTSSKTSIGQFGYSIGLALPVVIMSKLTSTQIVDKLKASGASAQEAAMGAESVASHVNTANITANKIDAQALDFAASSYFSSFHTNMLIISGCIAVLGVVTYLLLSTKNARKIETVIK